jgi:hypothetical protein
MERAGDANRKGRASHWINLAFPRYGAVTGLLLFLLTSLLYFVIKDLRSAAHGVACLFSLEN